MRHFFLSPSLIFTVLFVGSMDAAKELIILTGFFTGPWKPGGFSALEKEINNSSILAKQYEKIKCIDICLGKGTGNEELQAGPLILQMLHESINANPKIKEIPKGSEVTGIFSSLAGLLMRCYLQAYADKLPFTVRHFISICAPQAGINTVPLEGNYSNPVESACTKVQKATTEKIIQNYIPLSMPSFLFSSISYLSNFVMDQEKDAWKTLYQRDVQEKLISIWRDPYHLEEYQACDKNFTPFLPLFNNELRPQDAEAHKKVIQKFKTNLGKTAFFDFIASDDDTFMPAWTALCKERTETGFRKPEKLLNRIGVPPKKTTFQSTKAGHRCHTDDKIKGLVVKCLEARCS
ncbi:MAG: hypothetical protein M1549_04005 [Candidatus Dependentiae bacterium]|nr:hypothetical protein [Candidatus Dependentiae bacterium]